LRRGQLGLEEQALAFVGPAPREPAVLLDLLDLGARRPPELVTTPADRASRNALGPRQQRFLIIWRGEP
jgi:hypothetical protein